MKRRAPIGIALVALATLALPRTSVDAQRTPAGTRSLPAKTTIPFADAQPILEQLRASVPPELSAIPTGQVGAAWNGWVQRRDAEIRARLRQGDEDSVVNLLLFGTSFTRLPRAPNDSRRTGGPQQAAEIVRRRTADLAAALASPGSNERLQFARDVVRRRGIDPSMPADRDATERLLRELTARAAADVEGYARTIQTTRAEGRPEFAVRSSLYRTRGLSSDTSIRPDYAIDRAIEALAVKDLLRAGSVRRVAVIGPGLDFTDKAQGYDFYPQQVTQPFAVIGSLLRLGLAMAGDLRLTTLDVNPRVTAHLGAALQRAAVGAGYDVVLPRERDGAWRGEFLAFWRAFGRGIGEPARTAALPAAAGDVEVRAVRIAPAIVEAVAPRDLNVVVERLGPLADAERFDLVIATNVLVYYDPFEQSLALANVAAMLRPGGVLLSNNVLVELPTTPISSFGSTAVSYSNRPDDSDEVVWYRRH